MDVEKVGFKFRFKSVYEEDEINVPLTLSVFRDKKVSIESACLKTTHTLSAIGTALISSIARPHTHDPRAHTDASYASKPSSERLFSCSRRH